MEEGVLINRYDYSIQVTGYIIPLDGLTGKLYCIGG